jgi:uncharacterized protein
VPIFAVQYSYSEATTAERDTYRPSHRDYLRGLLATGELLSSGPYPDGSGALLLFRATDKETLAALLAADPFVTQNLIAEITTVEWHPVLGAFAE